MVANLTQYGEVAYNVSDTEGKIVGVYGEFDIKLLMELETLLWEVRECFECGYGTYIVKCHGNSNGGGMITEISGYYQDDIIQAINRSPPIPENIILSKVKH